MSKTSKTIIWFIVIVIVIIAVWLGVSRKPVEKETIKIGATLPLTGELSDYGVDAKNAIDLAVEEINNEGGVEGRKIEIIYEDDQCDPKTTVTTVNKLINIDKVEVTFGPFCSGAALAAAPVAQNSKKILLSGSATNPKLADYNLFFRTIPSDTYQGEFGAEYVYNKLGKRNAAIAYVQNDYAVGVKDSFKKKFIELGGKIVIEEEHQEGATDLRTQITKIKNTDADVLYFVPYPVDGGYFLKQAKELALNLLIFAPEVVEGPQTVEIGGPGAEGMLFTRAKEEKNEEFRSKYNSAYEKEPGAYAAFYYDAVKILASALAECGESVDCIRNYFVSMGTYKGVSGEIKFDENGDLVGREFIIKTVKNGQFVPYEE